MPLHPSAALKIPARESKVGHLKTRGYLENSSLSVSLLLQWALTSQRDCAGDSAGKVPFVFFPFFSSDG